MVVWGVAHTGEPEVTDLINGSQASIERAAVVMILPWDHSCCSARYWRAWDLCGEHCWSECTWDPAASGRENSKCDLRTTFEISTACVDPSPSDSEKLNVHRVSINQIYCCAVIYHYCYIWLSPGNNTFGFSHCPPCLSLVWKLMKRNIPPAVFNLLFHKGIFSD